jgi:tRNA nucleotidyltransferase/poly(A) polymerase
MFQEWLKIREGRQELANVYKSSLSGVPQDPHHHPEGDVLNHVRLVRKAIPRAIQELQQLQHDPQVGPALGDLDFNLNPQEQQIVILAAWLHDVGKASATTIGGMPWQASGADGKIQAIGHQDPEHYEPQLQKLSQVAPPETTQLYLQNKPLLDFLIQHHMDFAAGGFSKNFLSRYFGNGRVLNTPEMKLLLVLMWADRIGRANPEQVIRQALEKAAGLLSGSAERSRRREFNIQNQSKPFAGSPDEFAQMLGTRAMARNQKILALKGKFPSLSDEEIARLIPEGFREFLEMAEQQPVTIPANIPVDKNIHILSNVLKQGDPNAQVYVVGGAVRDYLFHQFHQQPGPYKPKDMDLTTNLSEEQILAKLRTPLAIQHGIKVAEKQSVDTFGVVFASVNGSETYEIAPFRKDIGVADGRRPDHIERGTIYDDAMRRDLTINNLYYDFDRGVILDFNGNGQGIEDVKKGVARPVGDPFERFNEDKLRILRLVRFFSRFNPGSIAASLDSRTAAAIKHFGNLREQGITPERIFMEFTAGIKQAQSTASYLNNLVELGLMEQVFPGLQVDTSAIGRLSGTKNLKVVIALLLRNNPNLALALNQLKYPSDIAEGVEFLVKALQFGPEQAMEIVRHRDKRLVKSTGVGPRGKPMSPAEVQAHNTQITSTMKQDLTELARVIGDPTMAQRLTHLSGYQPPAVNSQDLMARGLKGPAIGAEHKRLVGDDYQKSFDDFLKTTNHAP